GPLTSHTRLGAGFRNLFVRGRGFSTDPSRPSGTCGLDSLTLVPTPSDPTFPCPKFQVGNAFGEAGVQVWDISAAFNGAGTTVFPTKSLADTSKPMLDLATVIYDPVNCSGGATCDHTTKVGPRQWNVPTLAYSTFGRPSVYGSAVVLGKPLKAYFLDRPYLHQQNVAGKFLRPPS